MIQQIKKRTGDIVAFNAQKIIDAIHKANLESIDKTFSAQQLKKLTENVLHHFTPDALPTVE